MPSVRSRLLGGQSAAMKVESQLGLLLGTFAVEWKNWHRPPSPRAIPTVGGSLNSQSRQQLPAGTQGTSACKSLGQRATGNGVTEVQNLDHA